MALHGKDAPYQSAILIFGANCAKHSPKLPSVLFGVGGQRGVTSIKAGVYEISAPLSFALRTSNLRSPGYFLCFNLFSYRYFSDEAIIIELVLKNTMIINLLK